MNKQTVMWTKTVCSQNTTPIGASLMEGYLFPDTPYITTAITLKEGEKKVDENFKE